MPGEPIPAATVHWPVQSGPVPPLAAFYSPRPETGFGAAGVPAGARRRRKSAATC